MCVLSSSSSSSFLLLLFLIIRASRNRLFDAGISVISFFMYDFRGHRRVISKRLGGLGGVLRQSACRGVSHIL